MSKTTKKEMIVEVTFTIEQGRSYKMDVDEARTLYEQLGKLFADKGVEPMYKGIVPNTVYHNDLLTPPYEFSCSN